MFQGCFYGHIQGLSIFQEKDQGSISQELYCAYTVLIIHRYIELMKRQRVYLVLIQDGALGYTVGETKQELEERRITVIFWPLFSPDLNPIERVQYIIKNYLQDNYPEKMLYDQLRVAVKDTQDKIGRYKFEELINSIKDRCQAVIDVNGLFTKY